MKAKKKRSSKKFWDQVNSVIKQSDVVLLVMDARWVDETRNKEIEDKVKKLNKPLIYVINKCDLVDKLKDYKLKPSVKVSIKDHTGLLKLKSRIIIEGKKDKILVGVLGYPNVGKSSVINMIKGKRSAPTSSISGFTKHVQKVKAGKKIMFLDTPGVIPYREKDFLKHAMTNVIGFSKIREPDLVVMELMEKFPGRIEKYYGVKTIKDKEKTIEDIAIKKNIIKKGNKPDEIRMSVIILKAWQKGVIKGER